MNRFAVAASLAAGLPYTGVVRSSASGRVHLPGVGIVLNFGPRGAASRVVLETDGRTVQGSDGQCRVTSNPHGAPNLDPWEEGPGWAFVPRVGWGVWFDLDGDLLCAHITGAAHPELDRQSLPEWQQLVDGAAQLIAKVEGRLRVPVRQLLHTIVPVYAPPGRFHSCTLKEALGAVHVSKTTCSAMMAETLVHEAAHTQLNLLLNEPRFWRREPHLARFRSPWRQDLRPIQGMVHGLWAFHTVGEFWALLLRAGCTGQTDRLARKRLHEVSLQLPEARAELTGAPELNAPGEELIRELECRQEWLLETSARFSPPEEDVAEVMDRMRRHREALPERPAYRTVSAGAAVRDVRWSEVLGGAMPPPPTLMADGRQSGAARSHTPKGLLTSWSVSERIMVAASRSEPDAVAWMALATQTAETEPQSAMLAAGSIHYASGDFERAVTCFCRYVNERVDDVDAWNLLAAALRRSGRLPEADAIVFRLPEVIGRARQTACDVTWLREFR